MFLFAHKHSHDNSSHANTAEESHILHLVQNARQGQRDAFDEIVFLYRDKVYSTAWNLTRDADDAMDVTQEAFLRAYKSLSAYKGRSRFSTWLHRIVLNTSIDYLRREKKHRHESLDQPPGSDSDGSARQVREIAMPSTQREDAYAGELQTIVLQALNQLSTRQRQVFILRYYQDLDTGETAKVLKCTEGSVKRHLFRAQTRLRELMRDQGLQNDR